MNKRLILLLTIIIFGSLFISVHADDETKSDGGNDFAKSLGSVAQAFVIMGFIYSALRRTYIASKYLPEDYADYVPKIGERLPPQKNVQNFIRDIYQRFRSPILTFHYIVNISATIIAAIHGYFLLNLQDIGGTEITGILAATFMIILSISGFFIWLKFKPIWNYREAKTAIKFVHRQWIFTGLFLLFFIIHAG